MKLLALALTLLFVMQSQATDSESMIRLRFFSEQGLNQAQEQCVNANMVENQTVATIAILCKIDLKN